MDCKSRVIEVRQQLVASAESTAASEALDRILRDMRAVEDSFQGALAAVEALNQETPPESE